MERISRFRAVMIIVFICGILTLYAIELFRLQIVETNGNTDNTTTYTTVTTVRAARGDILDRNGNKLVGNRASYDLVFNHYVIKSADNTNQHLYNLLKKCEELGISYNDHFPVTRTRPFEYTLDDYNTSWNNYFQLYMTDREMDSDITAHLLVQTLRERYDIPEEWTDEEARGVIALRYEFDLRGVTNLSNYVFIEDVSSDDLSALLELNIPGLMVEASTVREYYTSYAAHILGSVGAMDASEWEVFKDQNYSMDAYVGQSGFEEAFESELHGIDGTRVDVVDKNGTIIEQYYARIYDEDGNVIGYKEPQAGNNVETTIDLELQIVAEDALAELMEYLVDPQRNTSGEGLDAEGAAVIVMSVKTGEILACASYPTYNPATLMEDIEEISANSLKPMFNRAFGAYYAPGSTYKMCTLVAAMISGVYTPGELIKDEGVYTKYDFNRSCLLWTTARATHGEINAQVALEVSCNYFFYELGDRLSIYDLDETAIGFGLGEPTGIEITEKIGWRANEASKAANYSGTLKRWVVGDRILAAIGQSENRFTPLQLCVYACTLANQGTRYSATFLRRVVSSDYTQLIEENLPEIVSQLPITDEMYNIYMQGMRQVVTGPGGTGRAYFGGNKDSHEDENGFWPYADIEVVAKTGTAQHGSGGSDHGAFLCFAPMDDPEIAVVVYGEKVAHGSTLGIVAEEILRAYFSEIRSGEVVSYENQVG